MTFPEDVLLKQRLQSINGTIPAPTPVLAKFTFALEAHSERSSFKR
jgi:hypothetical protein